MTDLCIIGNSHISSFVLGWKKIGNEYPNIRLNFFGAPGKGMEDLAVKDGELVPATPELMHYFEVTAGGKSSISGNYDAYLVIGLRLGFLHMEALFGSYRFEALAPDERALVSDECFARALRGCVLNSPAVRTVEKIRFITAAPILVIPDPLPTSGYRKCEYLNRAESRGEEKWIAQLFAAACGNVCREFNATCFFQPEFTKSAILRTKDVYSHGSINLRSGFRVAFKRASAMAKHMNAEFGTVMLRELFGLSCASELFESSKISAELALAPAPL